MLIITEFMLTDFMTLLVHTAIKWYLKVLPTLKEDEKPLEVMQYPGETIFIPSGS
jgi:hypothetical protein